VTLPLLTTELVRTLDRLHTELDLDRIGGLARLPDNPYRVVIGTFGRATAFAAGAIANTYYNKVLGLGAADVGHLPELAAFFTEHGSGCCRVDILPGDLDLDLADQLTALGLRHVGFQAGYYGLPAAEASPATPGLEVRTVESADDLVRFLEIFHAGFELDPASRGVFVDRMRYWGTLPGWTLYLVSAEGTPCAAGVFFSRGEIGYLALGATLPAYRRHGCHVALVKQGLAIAHETGCRLVCGQCDFDSGASRNYERLGLRLAYTKALWEWRGPELRPPVPADGALYQE
jgi:GNAT superfamily N-acetyltransferase